MEEAGLSIGCDIGGTNLRAAVVNASGEILASHAVVSPKSVGELEDAIGEVVDKLAGEHDVQAVGLAVAAFLDPSCELVRFAPHLPWRDRPVRAILEEKLGLPVVLEHDANSAAWGEYRFGGARGADDWVLFALGTGIGATLMSGGEIYRGAFGTAPEFGHLPVVPGGRACPCGKRGCLERYCSGTALEQTCAELLEAGGRSEQLSALVREGTLSGDAIFRAARGGDPVAEEAVADFLAWLGQGLSMVADTLDPELILLGGGVAADLQPYLEQAGALMAAGVVGAGHRPLPALRCAELGPVAGMIGVADLARRRLTA